MTPWDDREVSVLQSRFVSKPTGSRVFAQSSSWRVIATLTSGVIGYASTGTVEGALTVAGIDLPVKWVGQVVHDCFWAKRIQWGYTKPQEVVMKSGAIGYRHVSSQTFWDGYEATVLRSSFVSKPSGKRIFAQSTSWRVIATVASGIIGYVATGTAEGALSVAGADLALKWAGHLVHEAFWMKCVKWGYSKSPERYHLDEGIESSQNQELSIVPV
ncbi:MAG: putative membrane protein [Chlamydiales bacterium]|jgi:uncharacterized membrane protein